MLSKEVRECIVAAYEKIKNETKVAEYFSVDPSTVSRLVKQKRETGSLAPRTSERERKRILSDEEIHQIDELVQEQPDITIAEIKEKLNLKVSKENIRTTILELGYRYKKKSVHAWERERPRCGEETGRMERKSSGNPGGASGISG